jgi:predicted LPLAT superfamily acyltransferase
MSHWSKIEEQAAGYWRLRLLLVIYRYFGRFVLQIAVLPAVLSVFLFSAKMRRFSWEFLNNVYLYKKQQGDLTLAKPSLGDIFKHFYSFADSLADKVDSWEGRIAAEKIEIQNQDVFDEFVANLQNKCGPVFVFFPLGDI